MLLVRRLLSETRSRPGRVAALRCATSVGVVAASLACSPDEGEKRSLTIEFAEAPVARIATSPCAVSTSVAPSGKLCVVVDLREAGGTTRPSLAAATTADFREAPLALETVAGSPLSFDVRGLRADARYDLRVYVHLEDGSHFGSGEAFGFQPLAGAPRVRVHPPGLVGCGPSDDATPPSVARAFHAALEAGGGDVLLVGGIQASDLPLDLSLGAPLVPEVLAYRAATQRIEPVEVVGLDGNVIDGIRRVWFAAVPLTPEDGHSRFRLVGGFTSDPDAPVLAFTETNSSADNLYRAPVVPTAESRVAEDVIVRWDGENGRLILQAPPDAAPAYLGAANVASPPAADGSSLVVVGLSSAGPPGPRIEPPLARALVRVAADGAVVSVDRIATARFGAAVTRLDDAQQLVFGGNIDAGTAERVVDTAGLVVGANSRRFATAREGDALPPAGVFLSAGPISGGALLFGGQRVGNETTGLPITASFVDPPLAVVGGGDASLPVFGVEASRRDLAIRSAAMGVVVAHRDEALVIGGYTTIGTAGAGFEATPQLVRVSREADGYVAGDPTPQLRAETGLLVPRFAHAAARMHGDRWLVTGGLRRDGAGLDAVATTEVIDLGQARQALPACARDAAIALYGSVEPGSDAGTDRPPDGGRPDPDASAPPDAAAPDARLEDAASIRDGGTRDARAP